MRTFKFHAGPCETCGRHVACGAYWVPIYRVLDLGVHGSVPHEPAMNEPRRCDDCEILHRLQDAEYRRLCWPMADRMEQHAINNGGVIS
jgi:hypothetical protein